MEAAARFRVRAVVDWIELEIRTTERTNFATLRRRCGIPHVIAYDDLTGQEFPKGRENAATALFRFRIQDPEAWSNVTTILTAIDKAFPFACSPTVTGVEVALDAYSKGGNREELAEQAASFFKFMTHPISANRRLYRDCKGSGRAIPQHFSSLARHLLEGWQVGIGDKAGDRYQHIYVKTTDYNKQPLSHQEHRARYEITLRGTALPCKTLSEWARFQFAALSQFFNFRALKPDLTPLETVTAEATAQIGERRTRNRRGGGTRLYSRLTRADRYLNDKASEALRGLTDRWKTQPKRPRRAYKTHPEIDLECGMTCGNSGDQGTLTPCCETMKGVFSNNYIFTSEQDAEQERISQFMMLEDGIPSLMSDRSHRWFPSGLRDTFHQRAPLFLNSYRSPTLLVIPSWLREQAKWRGLPYTSHKVCPKGGTQTYWTALGAVPAPLRINRL